ncbi:DUF2199 domain-containing protein [Paenibacillus radicis (ex Xue et al. 2023)]|uniref:DUF2199 domain-containing protein n=1 Tax=Paenibacillus radicis (ex Xue et al. 2023) TaxID=2972489 RepID=A0ABT1YK06_9BACL|nr:DUF2199 domain-containing protein [Paenibacillus radicis (ex Xue et al. 2023)]MCR8633527.1 DUF2199 domain-containing protein [Paenibacillus radicis (ex Xue et al. 2023)]
MNFFKKNSRSYICSCCGKKHDELPMSYGSHAPYIWFQTKAEDRDERFSLDSDLCVMDNKHFFIRGNIEIPVEDEKKAFIWDVWVSLSKDNFEKSISCWTKKGREKDSEPMFGWLSTSIPCYSEETLNLKTMVHTRKLGSRPSIELEPTEHPLAVEQRNGIKLKRVQEIAERILHMNG